MVAETVLLLPGSRYEVIDRAADRTGAHSQLAKAEAANVETGAKEAGIVSRRHDEVDSATQGIGAKAQGVGTLVDLDIPVGGRVDFLEVTGTIGSGHRNNAVHDQLDAATVKVARQAGASDGQA